MDVMQLPRTNILAYTLPGFGTTERTLQQARRLMQTVGASAHEIDIRDACMQMFRNIGHPYATGKPVFDTSFENVQAGERTSHLFRLANLHGALVVGTGDLSELAHQARQQLDSLGATNTRIVLSGDLDEWAVAALASAQADAVRRPGPRSDAAS